DLEFDLIKLRRIFLPVIGIAHEDDPLAQRPFFQLVGAAADRALAEIGAKPLDFLFRHGKCEVELQNMKEGGIRARQVEPNRMRVDYDDARERLGLAAICVLEALDRTEEARTGTLRLWIDRALDRVFHVIRGDR